MAHNQLDSLRAFAGLALSMVLLGVPLMARRVPPNRWYGFRLPATLRDERLWYEVNAKTGADLVALGLALGFAELSLIVTRVCEPYLSLSCAALLLVGSSLLLVHGLVIVRRHARSKSAGSGGELS